MNIKLKNKYKPKEILWVESNCQFYEFPIDLIRPEIKAIIFPEKCTELRNGEQEISKLFPNLMEVIWPKIEKMEKGQFAYCKKLKYFQTVSCEKFPELAFTSSGLTSIVFPKNLKIIGMGCFKRCGYLKSVDMTKLKIQEINIPADCFSWCRNLRSFDFNKCKTFGEYSFNGTSLRRAVFNFLEGKEGKIGKYAFANTTLEYFEINGDVRLSEKCFSSCSFLKEAKLNNSIKEIPASTFSGDDQLCKIVGAENVETIGSYCFLNCAFNTLNDFKSLKEIKYSAFRGNQFEEVTINASTIEDYAFGDCLNLKKMTLTSSNLKEFPSKIVSDIASLDYLNLKNTGITFIPESMFSYAQLKEIVLPDRLKEIQSHAFSNSKITQITLPDSVVKVNTKAFYCCMNLEKIVWSKNCKNIGHSAFGLCSNLKYFIGSEYIESIENWAFEGTSVNLNFPNLKVASDFAFEGYTGIADLRMSSVEFFNPFCLSNVLLPYFYE